MIIELIINVITGLVKLVFSWINLPQFPQEGQQAVSNYLDLIFNNLSFLGFFVHISTFKICAISAITLFSFTKLYKVTMWIYHKLPISSN